MNASRKHIRTSLTAGLLAVILACSLCPALAFGTPASDKQAEAEAALETLNSLQMDLDKASDDYFQALAEQEAAQSKMDEAQKRIDVATLRISELQTQLSTRARSMYRNGVTTFIDILLGSSTFTEFATNWDLLDQMNEKDASMVQETKKLRAEIQEQKEEFARQEKIAAEKKEEAEKVKDEAQKLVDEMQATYDSLSEEAAILLEQERAAQSAAAASNAVNSIGGGGGNSGYLPPADDGTIVGRAMSYVGNGSYVWGACSPGEFDCSGFVSYCLTGSYSRLGTTYTFLGWPEVSDPQPGDICVNEGHCGIYVGNGMMAHAASPGEGIIVSGVQGGMIYVRY